MPESVQLHEQQQKGEGYSAVRTYKIKTKIKDMEYTNDLVSLTIVSTLASAYQMFFISLFVDPNDIILNTLFGGDPIIIELSMLRELGIPESTINFELMYLTSDFKFAERSQKSGASEEEVNWERTVMTIHAVPKDAYKTMATLVNDVFIGSTLRSIVGSLASKVGAKLDYDSAGENTTSVDQICIPPTTFYKIIKEAGVNNEDIFDGYLDKRFGLFEGVAGVFCNHDNTVYVKNLTERIKRTQEFVIYQLAGMSSEEKETTIQKIADEVDAGKAYYTFNIIQSEYYANAKFATISSDIKHIVKPAKKLFTVISQNLEDIAKNNSLIAMSNNLTPNFYLNQLVNRTRYMNEDTGYEDNTTLFTSMLSKSLSDLSTISFDIERNLDIKHAFNIGDSVKFKPMTVSYAALEGKYILFRSEITFSRRNNWISTGNITLIRSNKTS
jgi:hypothetical protein